MSRLVYVVNNPAFFLSHRLPLALEARRHGYDVHVATPPGDSVGTIRDHGFPFHPLSLGRGSRNAASEGRALASLVALYRKLRPTIVHHVTIKPVLYGSLAARLTGVPGIVNAVSGLGYVFMANGAKAEILRGAVRALYRVALAGERVRLIVQNDDDRRQLLAMTKIPERRVRLIRGSGVDLASFRERPFPDGPPMVVVPARLLADKGIREFVTAARLLRAKGSRARFVLAGGRDEANPTCLPQAEVDAWAREGVVEIWGHQTNMPEVLAQAHIVCMPSYREGLSKSLIEAAAAGRPIVTTDVPGCRDVVEHEDNGLLVPKEDANSLAIALARLLENESLRAHMGVRGRLRATRDFDVKAVCAATMEIYASLEPRALSQRRRGAEMSPVRAPNAATATAKKRVNVNVDLDTRL